MTQPDEPPGPAQQPDQWFYDECHREGITLNSHAIFNSQDLYKRIKALAVHVSRVTHAHAHTQRQASAHGRVRAHTYTHRYTLGSD